MQSDRAWPDLEGEFLPLTLTPPVQLAAARDVRLPWAGTMIKY